jgi:hypothetical protein
MPYIYIYALGLWSGYQRAFKMVGGFTEDRKSGRRARLALVLGLGLRARELGQLYPYPARQVGEAETFQSAREAVRPRCGELVISSAPAKISGADDLACRQAIRGRRVLYKSRPRYTYLASEGADGI